MADKPVTWTTTIDATPEQVFEPLSDLTRHSNWSQKPYKAEKTSEGPVGVGTTYKSWGWLPPKSDEWENAVKVTGFDPGKRFAFEATDEGGTVPSEFVLRADGGGTRVERTMNFPKPKGFTGVMWPVIFPMLVKPAIQKNLDAFRDAVQDGKA